MKTHLSKAILILWVVALSSTAAGFVGLSLANRTTVSTLGLAAGTRFQTLAGSPAATARLRPLLKIPMVQARSTVKRLLWLDSWFAASVMLAVLIGAHIIASLLPPLMQRRLLVAGLVIPLALASGLGDLLENYLLSETLLAGQDPGSGAFAWLKVVAKVKLLNFVLLPLVLAAGAVYVLRYRKRTVA